MDLPGDTVPDVPTWQNVHHGPSNGDFARLVPHSPAARKLFSQVVHFLESDHDKWYHVCKYIHSEATYSEESTAESSSAAATPPPHREPEHERPQDYCGYYRLNMTIPPGSEQIGWVLGSCYRRPGHFVDFLLALFTNEHALHSRHCRLRRLLDTGVLLAVSDSRKVGVDGKDLQRDLKKQIEQNESEYQASLKNPAIIRLGDLTYRLTWTDLSEEHQQKELQQALDRVDNSQNKSVMLLSPTPSKPMIDYHGCQMFDARLHGTTSTVSLGYEKSSGKAVAVKIVKCTRAQYGDLGRDIDILQRLDHRNVIKLDKVVNWDPSACPLSWHPDECRAVGLIMSPSATIRAPELLSSWKSFPDPAAFLRASVYQLASGLAYIHSLDILHRDIKPENIIYQSTSPAHATIVDFGASDPSPTSVRHGRGTITYLAPEVMRIKDGTSDQPFSFPSDIWSLGVTLVDFLWGEQYHSELGRSSVYRNFQMIMDQNTRVQPYPQYCKLVQELLAWNPESRLSATVLAKRFPEQEAEYGQNRSQQDGRRRRNSSDGGSSAKCERLQDSHERRITLSTL